MRRFLNSLFAKIGSTFVPIRVLDLGSASSASVSGGTLSLNLASGRITPDLYVDLATEAAPITLDNDTKSLGTVLVTVPDAAKGYGVVVGARVHLKTAAGGGYVDLQTMVRRAADGTWSVPITTPPDTGKCDLTLPSGCLYLTATTGGFIVYVKRPVGTATICRLGRLWARDLVESTAP